MHPTYPPKRLHLHGLEHFTHYMLTYIFLIASIIGFLNDINQQSFSNHVEAKVLIIFLGLLCWIIQYRRLRFMAISTELPKKEIVTQIYTVAKELNWQVSDTSKPMIVAHTPRSWRSWGERITILLEKDKVWVNSICDPSEMPAISAWGRNRRNERRLMEILMKTK